MFPENQLRLKFLMVHKSESNLLMATCISLYGNMVNRILRNSKYLIGILR